MQHLDLFSGIGGFALAARNVGWTTTAFCEIDPFCQRVLAKHFPGVPIYDDIRTLEPEAVGPVQLITGGYPCQPFSYAGVRAGTADERHLWPEVARLVRDLNPAWCVFENVAGHITLGLDQVLADLDGLGYAHGTFIIPAAAADAAHRRDRLWIVANTNGSGHSTTGKPGIHPEPNRQGPPDHAGHAHRDVADALRQGLERPDHGELAHHDAARRCAHEAMAHTSGVERTAGLIDQRPREVQVFRPWPAEPNVGRMAHGVPDRVDRLRALGNAIVPQVAERIFHAINMHISAAAAS